jgi:hypothetical protein
MESMKAFKKHFATRSQIEKHNKEVKEVMKHTAQASEKGFPYCL